MREEKAIQHTKICLFKNRLCLIKTGKPTPKIDKEDITKENGHPQIDGYTEKKNHDIAYMYLCFVLLNSVILISDVTN